MVAYAITPLMGIDPSATSTLAAGSSTVYVPEYTLGARAKLSDTGEAIYIRATSPITAGHVLLISAAGAGVPITTALADKGGATPHQVIAVANTTLAAGQHGWACTGGTPLKGISVLASCVRGSPLYTTTTAGALDDTDVSAHLINNVYITTTATAAAVTAGFLPGAPALVSGVVHNT